MEFLAITRAGCPYHEKEKADPCPLFNADSETHCKLSPAYRDTKKCIGCFSMANPSNHDVPKKYERGNERPMVVML